MKAHELMSAFPAVVTPETHLSKAAEAMRDRQVGLLPVVDDERHMRLVGVITDRDMTVRCLALAHAGRCLVREHMTSASLETARTDDDAGTVLDRMSRARVRRLPVVDHDGRVVGVIAQADVVRRMSWERARPRAPVHGAGETRSDSVASFRFLRPEARQRAGPPPCAWR